MKPSWDLDSYLTALRLRYDSWEIRNRLWIRRTERLTQAEGWAPKPADRTDAPATCAGPVCAGMLER